MCLRLNPLLQLFFLWLPEPTASRMEDGSLMRNMARKKIIVKADGVRKKLF
jgi:hypothetical protein